MNAQIDIPYERRYQSHPLFGGGFGLLDRISGKVEGNFDTRDEADAEAARRNNPA